MIFSCADYKIPEQPSHTRLTKTAYDVKPLNVVRVLYSEQLRAVGSTPVEKEARLRLTRATTMLVVRGRGVRARALARSYKPVEIVRLRSFGRELWCVEWQCQSQCLSSCRLCLPVFVCVVCVCVLFNVLLICALFISSSFLPQYKNAVRFSHLFSYYQFLCPCAFSFYSFLFLPIFPFFFIRSTYPYTTWNVSFLPAHMPLNATWNCTIARSQCSDWIWWDYWIISVRFVLHALHMFPVSNTPITRVSYGNRKMIRINKWRNARH